MQRKDSERSTVSDLGEFSLIARLNNLLPPQPSSVRIGRGRDDAAVLQTHSGYLLATCDAQVEGYHFQRQWITPRQLGRRAAAVNLSDIASMGGTPRFALVSLFLPKSTPKRFYDDVMRGIGEQLLDFKAHVVGGNLSQTGRRAIVDLTLLGNVDPKYLIRRDGARMGDHVLVSGFPGESAAGLALFRQNRRDIGGIKKRFLAPTPRVVAGKLLARLGATSMIDISDGLSSDLLHVCDASRVGVQINVEHLPISKALQQAGKRLHRSPQEWVLHGGESYELLFTLPARHVAKAQAALQQQCALPTTDIGVILHEKEGRWAQRATERNRLRALGYRHF